MKILALEFSSPQRSVAVDDAQGGRTPHAVAEVIETGGIATKPLQMIDQALREAKLEREQIEVLAVGLGPGSYTGIRTAIALAQGWHLARGVKLVGISSAECIAAEAQAADITGQVTVVIDAQRGDFYLASYELSPAGRRELQPLRLAPSAEVQALRNSGVLCIGPESIPHFPKARLVFPRARILARLAIGRSDFVDGAQLEPIYLRETAFLKSPPPSKTL
jgi:tRNA threonylcarbamoyladenosine biosynthesis protein TsaB